jgi:hypothetical protein
MFEIQMLWWNNWITVEKEFSSKEWAEWRAAEWKQQNQCYGDPFRVVRSEQEQRTEETEPRNQ